jgi:SPP1 gp7 family putative phage head morphogenesis protein
MAAVDAAGGPTKDTIESIHAPDPSADLAVETERLLFVSYLLGSDHLSTRLELADEPEAIPFDDAAAFLRARVPLTKDEWTDLEPKLRFRAFTTAALSTPDAVDRVRRMAVAAIDKGTPFSEFWTAAKAESAAGLGDSPWYWETVYRTNVQTAYNAGRAAEVMRLNPPYLEFVGIEDSRQTSICQERSGTILPSSHPFWQSNWPPLHFNCRSTVRAVFAEEVDAMRENGTWSPTPGDVTPPSDAATGFGGNPIETGSFYRMTPGMVERAEKYGLRSEIEKFARAAGIKDYALAAVAPKVSVVTPAAQVAMNAGVPQFKTVKEAEAYILKNDLADDVSFKGCDLRVVQDWTYAWAETLEEYPEARKGMQFFGTIQERNNRLKAILEQRYEQAFIERNIDAVTAQALAKKFAGRDIRSWRPASGTIAEFTWTDQITGISVNKSVGSDWDLFKQHREYDVSAGWKPKGTATVESSLHHEVGHLLDWLTGLSNTHEIDSLYTALGSEGVADGLSRYAAENKKEFIAEAWSEYQSSERPRSLSMRIANELQRRLRP